MSHHSVQLDIRIEQAIARGVPFNDIPAELNCTLRDVKRVWLRMDDAAFEDDAPRWATL